MSEIIHIGNQTALSAASLMLPFEYAIANGFDAFEWFPDGNASGRGWDESQIHQEMRSRIRTSAFASRVRLSVHAPWRANPLKRESLETLVRHLEFARDLGAVLVNIHLYPEAGLDAYVKAIEPLLRRLPEFGLRLSIENSPLTEPRLFNELFRRLTDLRPSGFEHVGMCLDLGHANLCEPTRNDYLQYIDQLDPEVRIIHIHLHENWGDFDTHLPIFSGPSAIDGAGVEGFVERILKRNFSGSIILEQWPQPPTLLNQARERLRGMLRQHLEDTRRPSPPRVQTELPSSHPPSLDTPPAGTRLLPIKDNAIDQDSFIDMLAEADRRQTSWREKLESVSRLLGDLQEGITSEQLAYLAIYLRFLGTGEIACREDGRHFRPNHAAAASRRIQEHLAGITTTENAFIARKIYPWLPSSEHTFARAEPLTRIRDIAHRNDIPQELKREIKHTLQNKLHRCAGPEDLATSAGVLERITAPAAGYSESFVEQFKVFHEELREFFNARSLEDQLRAIAQQADAEESRLICRFLDQKENLEQGIESQLAALELLTALRRRFLARVEKAPGSETQAFRLAEITLESFCFPLLSRMINHFDAAPISTTSHEAGGVAPVDLTHPEADGPQTLSVAWELILNTFSLTLANVSLSGLCPEECQALESELAAWRQTSAALGREQLMRLKATVDRSGRLADEYSDRVTALFSGRVVKLGHALGVAEPAIRVFMDGDIRGHLIFQLSKLVASLSRILRRRIGSPPWDSIVTGKVMGRLIAADTLEEFRESTRENIVALLNTAQGDEEIPPSVWGIVLGHAIPHLSHLGVRARQGKVVLVAGEDPAEFDRLKPLAGKWVLLDADAQEVRLKPSPEIATGSAEAVDNRGNDLSVSHKIRPHRVELPKARLHSERAWIPLYEAASENSGSKATTAKRLEELSRNATAGFKCPPGFVVPFGVMEEWLHSQRELDAEYQHLVSGLDELPAEEFVARLKVLREVILQIPVPPEIGDVVGSSPPSVVGWSSLASSLNERLGSANAEALHLMVRSSANAEDLQELAGAGLYESVANIPPSALASAVRTVWASLWTERAAFSRKETGVPHAKTQMAVLVQKMITPEYSFVMHTVNPISRTPEEAYIELAVGLGEILASAAIPGTPYRIVCNKLSGETQILAFASFSCALWPEPAGGIGRRILDYSTVQLSRDLGFHKALGKRLAAVARFVEEAFGQPQDIEGAIACGEIYLVQSRPQQGLA